MNSVCPENDHMISAEYPGVEYFNDEVREGFFVSSMMKRYWAAQIKVLSEIDKVCRKYGIRWFADCGTLLGAVRHGGMIPWDDDMDICMLRKDWVRFFEVAKGELPEEYRVLSLGSEAEYEQLIGRIVNAGAINYSDEHLNEYFGCPYTVGVDVFPLDDLSGDEEKEEQRRKLASDVSDAYTLVESGKIDSQECRSLLAKIESDDHIVLHRKGNILRELRLLTEKLYSMYASDDAEYIALMPFWVSRHNHKYSKDLYKDILYLPFEYIRIPVPAGYDEVLRIEYGNYMAVRKGGGIHGYPVYGEQEGILKSRNNGNPYRYTLTSQTLDSAGSRKNVRQKCHEITSLLLRVHAHIENCINNCDTASASALLGKCQTLAISLGTLIEKQLNDSADIVHLLEEYCEIVYRVSESPKEEGGSVLDNKIEEVEGALNAYFAGKKTEVLFIVTKSKQWGCLKAVYDHYRSKPDAEVHVMPIPYRVVDRVVGADEGERNDRELIQDGLNIIDHREYDISKEHPDVIVTCYPYDDWGSTMDVSQEYYSRNLREHTDELIYVPCFDIDPPIDENDKAVTAAKVMLEQPAVLYSDIIAANSDKLKECYVTSLSSLSGHEEYWEDKIKVFPDTASEPGGIGEALPEKWRSEISGRKILVFGVNGSFLIENGSKAIVKLKEAVQTIKEASDNIACIFTSSEDTDGIRHIDPELWGEYSLFTESLIDDGIIVDTERDVMGYMDEVSAYYGTPGVLAHRCRNLGKPVMLMKIL